jgi:hypothetical protein
MSASKNKPKFDTASDAGSTPEHLEETPAPAGGLLSSPVVSGVLQTLGNAVNTDVVNNLVGQVGQGVGGLLTTISEHPFLQNDTNRGWVLIGGAVLGAFFLISMLWQFIFNFMLTYASVKVMLWFLEHYEPDESSEETVGDSYVSERSPVDVIEYLVVLLFVMALTPLSYLPYMSLFVNGGCVLLSITTLASKDYRRKVCRFVKDMLVAPDYQPGMGQEGRIHKSLQTFCYTIETLNVGTFNMASNSRTVYSDLKTSESFTDGLRRLTRRPLQMLEKAKQQARDAAKKKDDDYEDDLDESFD